VLLSFIRISQFALLLSKEEEIQQIDYSRKRRYASGKEDMQDMLEANQLAMIYSRLE